MGQKSALYNALSGEIMGYYDSLDSPLPATLPSGSASLEITDSEWQAGLSSPYQPVTVVNGALNIPSGPTLAQAQSSQIALLQSAFQQAEQAPVSITLASGVTASFGMTPHDWTKIVGLYAKYVAKGIALPSGYTITDITGKAQAVIVTDIESLMNAGEAQIQATIAKAATLIGQIEAATSVQEVTAVGW